MKQGDFFDRFVDIFLSFMSDAGKIEYTLGMTIHKALLTLEIQKRGVLTKKFIDCPYVQLLADTYHLHYAEGKLSRQKLNEQENKILLQMVREKFPGSKTDMQKLRKYKQRAHEKFPIESFLGMFFEDLDVIEMLHEEFQQVRNQKNGSK